MQQKYSKVQQFLTIHSHLSYSAVPTSDNTFLLFDTALKEKHRCKSEHFHDPGFVRAASLSHLHGLLLFKSKKQTAGLFAHIGISYMFGDGGEKRPNW